MRLSIDITPEQHQYLKAAALRGQSIKNYVLDRTLPKTDELENLSKLEQFLAPRIENAKREHLVEESIDDIFNEELKRL